MRIDQISVPFIVTMLNEVLPVFIERNKHLLEYSLNEPCLNHQLAICLWEYLHASIEDFAGVCVDCEYNKALVYEDFRKTLKISENKKRVIPDIIVHKRSSIKGENYLVFETKRRRNYSPDAKKYDKQKLEAFTDQTGAYYYLFGVFIEFDDGNDKDNCKHYFEIYENGKCVFSSNNCKPCKRLANSR